MSEQIKPTVSQEDKDGIRWVRIEQQKLGWNVDPQLLKVVLLEAISGAERVAVNFAEVAYVASPTIGTILSFNREATAAGCKVVLYDMQPYVRDTFAGLRLDKVLEICETEEEARGRLAG